MDQRKKNNEKLNEFINYFISKLDSKLTIEQQNNRFNIKPKNNITLISFLSNNFLGTFDINLDFIEDLSKIHIYIQNITITDKETIKENKQLYFDSYIFDDNNSLSENVKLNEAIDKINEIFTKSFDYSNKLAENVKTSNIENLFNNL